MFKIVFYFIFFSRCVLSALEFENPITKFKEIVVSSPCDRKFYGEVLEYDIYWGFINVGSAFIKVDKIVKINEKDYAYHIISEAKSNSFIEKFYPVKDLNEALLDVNISHSYGYYKDIQEGKYQKKEWVLYNQEEKKFRGQKLDRKNRVKEFEGEILPDTFDILSALYYFRIYEVNDSISRMLNVNTTKNWQLNIKVHGKEKINTQLGKIKCIVLEPQVGEEGIFIPKAGKRLLVYISEEEKLPVLLKAEVFIGSVKAELKSIKNLYCK